MARSRRAAAIFVRCRIPLLKPSTRRSATSSSPTVANASVRGLRRSHTVEVGDVAHELASRQRRRHGFVLRYQRHPAVNSSVSPRVPPFDVDRALVDRHQSRHRPHQRRLAGPVRSEQARDSRPERAAQLREGDLLAVPHRHVVHLHGGVGGERRIVGRQLTPAASARSSSFDPAVATQQDRGEGNEDDDVHGKGDPRPVLDAARAGSRERRARGTRHRAGTAAAPTR